MDPDDLTSIIFKKIRTLEPENSPKIIGYFLMQDMKHSDLIRLAFGPDTLLHTFCQKAKSDLGLSFDGFSLNPHISRPINIHNQPLSQSSPRNGFLEFLRNPNRLSPSLTPGTLSPFHDGSSLFADEQQQQPSNHFSFLNDDCLESDETGFGGSGYLFPQSGLVDDFGSSGGERKAYVCLLREEMMRMKLARQQRIAASQFLQQKQNLQRQRSGKFGEESGLYYKHEREDSVSKQIYLTFLPESSFTDVDVSDYFSNFGTVEDVRIPYKEQRMYGFVTFADAETVRVILSRGNPHFICGWRVLVKPYKEKGEILQNKKQQQQMQELIERGNYSPSSSPSGMDLYDCHLGPRMFKNSTQDMLRDKTEQQGYLQQAIDLELQRKRLLNLQLPERDNEPVYHHQHSLSFGSPAHLPPRFNCSLIFQSENNIEEVIEGDRNSGEKHLQREANRRVGRDYSNDFYNWQETSLENTLPDNLFGFPKTSNKTLQPESDTEKNKADSSDQSA